MGWRWATTTFGVGDGLPAAKGSDRHGSWHRRRDGIFYALESPELEVVGLTTVFGNADTEVTTRNALSLLEIAERSDIPVAAGAVKPLTMDYRGPAAFVHGPDGQGGVDLTLVVQ
jgi:inosine-uridine nucleoside N-ribohydrolase